MVDFVERFLEDARTGGVRPLEEYLLRYPGHPERIEAAYQELERERAALEGELPAEDGPSPLGADGPYRAVRVLGAGGQGVVHLAVDRRLGRRVALKLLHPAFVRSGAARERFRREAELVSRLDDPRLCAVYEAALDGPVPYIAMRHVEGRTLGACIGAARGGEAGELCLPLDRAALEVTLRAFEGLARALHAAHEVGVVHRDIKPGNLMATPEGRLVLLDFGLARDVDSDAASLTRSSEALGTPAYMAPEQRVRGTTVDRRADVYALALSLYECLTLARPFPEGEPATPGVPAADPARRNAAVPGELTTVLRRALEFDPERRYATAAELALELARIRRREPVIARPASRRYRLAKFVERNRRGVATAVVSLLTLGLGIAGAGYGTFRANAARRMDAARGPERLRAAFAALARGEPLALVPEGSTDAAGAPWEVRLFRRLSSPPVEVFPAAPQDVSCLATTSDGGLFVTTHSMKGPFQVLDTHSGAWRELPLRVTESPGARPGFALAPDGSRMVLSVYSGLVATHDLLSPERSWSRHFDWWPSWPSLSEDGALLAFSDGADPTVRILDAASGELLSSFEVFEAQSVLAFVDGVLWGRSMKGVWFRGLAGDDISTRLLDRATPFPDIWRHSGDPVLPQLARAPHRTDDLEALLAWLARGPERAVSPDGHLLAEGVSRSVRLIDRWSEKPIAMLPGHRADMRHLAWDLNGRLVAADEAGEIRRWDPLRGGPVTSVRLPDVEAGARGGGLVVSAHRGNLVLWRTPELVEARSTLPPHGRQTLAADVDPEGRVLALAGVLDRFSGQGGGWAFQVSVHEIDGSRELWRTRTSAAPKEVAFRPGGEELAIGYVDGRVSLVETATGREAASLEGPGPVSALAWSPGGGTLYVGHGSEGGAGAVRAIAVDDRAPAWAFDGVPAVRCLARSADGALLATGDATGIVLRSSAGGAPAGGIGDLQPPPDALAFHPTEPRLAAALGTQVRLFALGPGGRLTEVFSWDLGIGKLSALWFEGEDLAALGRQGIGRLEASGHPEPLERAREEARRTRAEAVALLAEHTSLDELRAVFSRTGAPTPAQRALLEVAAFHEDPDRLNREAWIRLALGNIDAAEADRCVRRARRAVALAPGRGRYWNTLGRALLEAGLAAEATEAFTRSDAINHDDDPSTIGSAVGSSPFDLLLRARAHARLGDLRRARADLERGRAVLALPRHRLRAAELRALAEATAWEIAGR